MNHRSFTEEFLRFDTTDCREAAAQSWFRERLDEFGFETVEWTADADRLAGHPSFPDDPGEIAVADRPSVAGILEFGDPDAGPALVLNGHIDVVPADDELWESDPFEPTWNGDDLIARGAADMKSGLATCVFAALDVRDAVDAGELDLDGRIVVESVVGEEEGGIGAAAAALDNPYPFERDAAVVAEPTDLTVVTATEGSVMKRLELTGRSAHAATRWVGESVLPHFERIRHAFEELEAERGERVRHPLYEGFPVPWPVCVGRVEAGSWASSVPASLTAEIRIGVAPGETVVEVEAEYGERLAEVVAESEWLSEHPPTFERFSVQFESAETDADEPVVAALQAAMDGVGLADTTAHGATYGADSRHFVGAGTPTVLFGPGTVEQAHFPNETIRWRDVETARETLAATARRYLAEN
ncbi:M20/M25/M40 family metallo-hydrolase [Haloprofundus halobius]|uniref:M20/M25/M40 family metallo-hydrolase n=1 Tax=Haloprofundus halobius TaxID=2876194 RepID=UPI001CCD3822|nr:M20/M25/M40 family metallo-hydrolase [Haloprofundus halobius]